MPCAGVVLLTELANYFRLHQLNRVEKFVMSYGGLRGAIAFALVLLIDPQHVPRQPLFVTATITVVFFTVFVQVYVDFQYNLLQFFLISTNIFQGITIRPLVEFLKVKREEKRHKTMNERIHEKVKQFFAVTRILNVQQFSALLTVNRLHNGWDGRRFGSFEQLQTSGQV